MQVPLSTQPQVIQKAVSGAVLGTGPGPGGLCFSFLSTSTIGKRDNLDQPYCQIPHSISGQDNHVSRFPGQFSSLVTIGSQCWCMAQSFNCCQDTQNSSKHAQPLHSPSHSCKDPTREMLFRPAFRSFLNLSHPPRGFCLVRERSGTQSSRILR